MRLCAVVSLVLLSGCMKRVVTVPPEAFVTLGGLKASYRDWARVSDLCFVEPRRVEADFESMNVVVTKLLGQTSAGPDGIWADEHIALLEEAGRVLPVALDLQKRAVNHASKAGCRFEGLTRTTELTDMARARLAEAPGLLEVVKAKKALAAWKSERPLATDAAKEKACAKPGKTPVVFAAFEDEKGRTEWLFCDGAKVAAVPGTVPAYEAAPAEPAKKPKKPAEPKAYLEAQAKFPPEQVSRAPKLPAKKVARRDDAPEPEEAP